MEIQRCAACSREAVERGQYCAYHTRALDELKKHFSSWVGAYGSEMTWKQYLVAVAKRKETGRWIKEVAEIENKKEG